MEFEPGAILGLFEHLKIDWSVCKFFTNFPTICLTAFLHLQTTRVKFWCLWWNPFNMHFWFWFIVVKSRPQRAWITHEDRTGSWVTCRDGNYWWVVCRWDEGAGDWEDEYSVIGGDGKNFCPDFLRHFLENIDRRSCNDGSLKPISVFPNPHRKGRPSPSTVTL